MTQPTTSASLPKAMNTPKDSTGGCCPPPPCSADPFLEEVSDKIRRGEPVGIMEAMAANEYQRQRKRQEPPSLWERVVRFLLPNADDLGLYALDPETGAIEKVPEPNVDAMARRRDTPPK